MLRVFVLEDDPARIDWFKKKFKNDDLMWSDNVDQAKLTIVNYDFDILFLDHDLGGKVLVRSEEYNTGYQLAKWLREMDVHFQQIFIHSLNPVGAENIYQEVKELAPEVRKIPFLFLRAVL